jgi:HPt (histidine-containing phosphotransfer) domain-containing protein
VSLSVQELRELASQLEDENAALKRGLLAQLWLDEHGDEVAIGEGCTDCRRYAAEVFRGTSPQDAQYLRCAAAQEACEEVQIATKLALQL